MKLLFVPAEVADIPVIFSQAKELIDTYEDLDSIDYDRVLSWVKHKIPYFRVSLRAFGWRTVCLLSPV